MTGHCFVLGCSSGYASTTKKNKAAGVRNPSLFRAPKDTELLEKWRRAIPRKDKILDQNDRICEFHFQDEDIYKNFVNEFPYGIVSVIERERVLLRKGAVPSIFPNVSKYLTKKSMKRKRRASRVPIPSKIRKTDPVPDEALSQINIIKRFPDRTVFPTCPAYFSNSKNEINKKIEADDHQDEQEGNSYCNYKVNPQCDKDDSEGSNAALENTDDVENIKKKRKIMDISSSSAKILDTQNGFVHQPSDREEIFGQYLANEMRTLRDNPLLYLQTKQAILEILTSATFELVTPQ